MKKLMVFIRSFFIAFAVVGILLSGFIPKANAKDYIYVTATLVECTPVAVADYDSDSTGMELGYRCKWKYERNGRTLYTTTTEKSKPSSTTQLRISIETPWKASNPKNSSLIESDGSFLWIAPILIGLLLIAKKFDP